MWAGLPFMSPNLDRGRPCSCFTAGPTTGTPGARVAPRDTLSRERVDLIAHDWGAWIGFILCLEHPQRFSHYLALNMYTPWPDPPSPRGIAVAARLWYQVALATPGLGEALIRRTSFVRRLITAGAVHEAWTGAGPGGVT